MKYSLLGNTTLSVSAIGFGCMSLGEDQNYNKSLIYQAFDSGINFFDTADLYQHGRNEEWVGMALKERRKEVILATKVGNEWLPDGSGWTWNPHRDYILAAVEKSLARLQTDYIDLYQLHGGTIDDPIDETIEAFELLLQQGKIRAYGISSIRPNVIREYVQRANIASVMMQYSLLDRRPEEAALPLLQQEKIGVLARGPVAKGLLVNKAPTDYLNYNKEAVQQAARAIQSISGAHRSPAQTAIRFVLQHEAITSAIVGIRTHEQLVDAVEALETPPLTEAELQVLRGSITENYYTEHR